MAELSSEQLRELDRLIFEGKKILGIKLIRDATDLSLHESLNRFGDRFEELKESQSATFTADLATYWDGFSS